MAEQTLSLQDPLARRILAWMDERFPFANAVLFFILYLVSAWLARYLGGEGAIQVGAADVVACLVTWSFFLLLRVFDEHKDYELDVKNHPQRVLQSGLITLNHLKVLGAIGVVLQLAWSLYLDGGVFGPVTTAWAVMVGWSLLMLKEFFCGEWLEKRLTLYAFSHMLIMPLIVWWLMQMGQPGLVWTPLAGLMMALSFVTGFGFEITRKTRGPEEERDTVDSYTKVFGVRGASCIVMLLIGGMALAQILLVFYVIDGLAWRLGLWAVLLAGAFMALDSVKKFWLAPSLAGRERNEKAVALCMLIGYAVLLLALGVERGLALA